MTSPSLPVNRAAVGWIALGLLLFAVGIQVAKFLDSLPEISSLELLQGGMTRVRLLMGAIWLALPSRSQEAAWARISPQTAIGLLIAAVMTSRVRLQFLIPAIAVVAVVVVILRPRPKKRPSGPGAT